MFSIHCKVLRVGQQKTEGMLVQNTWKRTTMGLGIHHRNPLQSLVNSPSKFSTSLWKCNSRDLQRPHSTTDWSCSQSTDHVRLVAAQGWECLTLQHVAAGRFLKEIFKDPHYED